MVKQRHRVAGIAAGTETEVSCLEPRAKSRDGELGLG